MPTPYKVVKLWTKKNAEDKETRHCTLWEKDMTSKAKEKPAQAAGSSKNATRKALERYLHYFQRFKNHEESGKLDQELSEKIQSIMQNKKPHKAVYVDGRRELLLECVAKDIDDGRLFWGNKKKTSTNAISVHDSDSESEVIELSDEESVLQFEDSDYDSGVDQEEFTSPLPAQHAKYSVYSSADLFDFQSSDAESFAAVAGCSSSQSALVLRHFNWDLTKAMEAFCDRRIGSIVGIGLDDAREPELLALPGFECSICFDNDLESTLSLSCGHRYCSECYAHSLQIKIMDFGTWKLKCLDPACKRAIDERVVKSLVSPETNTRYQKLLLEQYVISKGFMWCPGAGCEKAAEYKRLEYVDLDPVVPIVECNCGEEFCFACKQADHRPSTCKIVKDWMKKKVEDSATIGWLQSNTKDCPKCNSPIEKNGGCNHMSCRKFCWVCLGNWAGHSCVRYVEDNTPGKQSRADIQEYLHYFTRFSNHEQSALLDQTLSEVIESTIRTLQDTTKLTWIDVQFLKTAKETLRVSRATLKWTYCFAYFLQPGNAKYMFEENMRDLEVAVEGLSLLLQREFVGALDQDDGELKVQVLDKAMYVSQRRRVLLEATAKDLNDKKLKFKA
ncbi:UNVERIFIED_CONTAM: hypothetical protein HDU68_001408 [Siphonaria sp. JEL0065]|nr:hypothetical protein HDU68_001408 [Siphonaria sp. JEL0065]